MDKLSINVNIGNRVYPLTIDREEEELIRKAAKRVNDNMKQLGNTYEVSDKQDLLAMTALFFSNKALEVDDKIDNISGSVTNKLQEIETDLEQYLSNAK
ncbi:MAG: cell division protein ZapA [Salibacteraceae bacterium]